MGWSTIGVSSCNFTQSTRFFLYSNLNPAGLIYAQADTSSGFSCVPQYTKISANTPSCRLMWEPRRFPEPPCFDLNPIVLRILGVWDSPEAAELLVPEVLFSASFVGRLRASIYRLYTCTQAYAPLWLTPGRNTDVITYPLVSSRRPPGTSRAYTLVYACSQSHPHSRGHRSDRVRGKERTREDLWLCILSPLRD